MNFKDFLDVLYCWEGNIMVYNKEYENLFGFYYPDETFPEKYLSWKIVAITPAYQITTNTIALLPLIDVVITEAENDL